MRADRGERVERPDAAEAAGAVRVGDHRVEDFRVDVVVVTAERLAGSVAACDDRDAGREEDEVHHVRTGGREGCLAGQLSLQHLTNGGVSHAGFGLGRGDGRRADPASPADLVGWCVVLAQLVHVRARDDEPKELVERGDHVLLIGPVPRLPPECREYLCGGNQRAAAVGELGPRRRLNPRSRTHEVLGKPQRHNADVVVEGGRNRPAWAGGMFGGHGV